MAGEMRQEWTWRDMFRSVGMAFSFSRLLVGFFGLALMAAADGLLAWAGYEVTQAGYDVAGREVASPWLVWMGTELFWYLRLIVVAYLFFGTCVAISYGVKGELLDGEGARAGESINFALRKIGAVFWTPVIFWAFIAIMAFLGIIWFLLGRIPVVGPSLTAFGWFAVFITSVLAAMGFLAFAFSFFLAPPIIAVRQEGALDAVLDTIDLMRGKGAFWVSILVLVATMLLGPVFLGKTFDVTYKVAEMTMGENYTKTVECLPNQIQPRRGTFFYWTRIFWPGRFVEPRAAFVSGDWSDLGRNFQGDTRYLVGGWWLGIMILIVAGFAVSFTLGAFVSAATLTYLIVREEEEFLEPVAAEPAETAGKAASGEEGGSDEESQDEESEEKKSKRKSKRQAKKESEE